MNSFRKALAATALVVVGAAALMSCSGLSEQDATDRCSQEQTARGSTCFDDSSFATCVSAAEECDQDAIIDETKCPITYTCQD